MPRFLGFTIPSPHCLVGIQHQIFEQNLPKIFFPSPPKKFKQAQPGGIHWLAWLFSQSLILPHVMNLFWGAAWAEGGGGGYEDGAFKDLTYSKLGDT